VSYRRVIPHTVTVSLLDVMSLEFYFFPESCDLDALSRFWSTLRNYAGPVTANSAISLPHNMTWLDLPKAPMKLFVRKAYLDLVDIVFGPNSNNSYCVTGTPGTGKTHFLFFLMYWCAKNNRTVVVSLKLPSVYIILDGESDHVDVSQVAPMKLLRKPSTILLADAVTPQLAEGPIVLTTSPNKDVYKDFIRWGADYLYMPVWSLDELHLCKRLCNMQISDDEIEARFKMSVSIPI